ncbi:MAG: CRISPR-associated endonuclease Cas1 [Methylacidiphilales bacterium]|nr:CRISPR-associated endonuclease Cas1 [Candidatus Methylacidiphilales bacterium]
MSTIYITEPDASFKVQNKYLKVFQQDKQRFFLRISNISQFAIFGNIKLPKDVMQIVRLNQIPVIYFTHTGEYVGRLENPSTVQAKYLNYQRQRLHDREFNRATAESIVWAKLHNQHTFLQNWTRYYTDYTTQRASDYLTLLMDNLSLAPCVEELHQYIEEADKVYYCAIASVLSLYSSNPHTTAKQINRFLTLGNQLLHQYIYNHLKTTGLHPDYGILYRDTHHELPLAWDFSAEFRAPIVDDLVLSFARNLAKNNGNGNGNGKKPYTHLQRFLQHWEGKLKTFVLHPYAGEVSYRQCIDLQVKEYIASLLGDVEYYRPLALKFHPEQTNFINILETQKPVLTLVK